MKKSKEWSERLIKLVEGLNNFSLNDYGKACQAEKYSSFFIDGHKVGVIQKHVLDELVKFQDIFKTITSDSKTTVHLNEGLTTVEAKSKAFERVLQDLRKKDQFLTLKGWRNETYSIYSKLGTSPLCHVERSGCCLFGFIHYGVHVNGYTFKDGQLMMWIGRRSKTKPTFPNMFDNMCAGGLASGLGITECTIKECQEEGSVDDETLKRLKPVGSVSYCYKDARGIFPETQYVYDLELTPDFEPKNADGEMQNFNLYTIEQMQDLMMGGEFKPNCALVVVDFLIRHGYITPDDEPNYCYIIRKMHTDLQP